MTESEAIKICNTIVLASSLSSPHGIPLNTTKEELIEAMKIAIQALEKQIPKKALNKKDALFANCPNCGRVQNSVWNKTYCGDCGKKLDWSD